MTITRQQRRAQERADRKQVEAEATAARLAAKAARSPIGYDIGGISGVSHYEERPRPQGETDASKFREEGHRFAVGDFVTRDGTDVHQVVSLPWDGAFHGTFRCVVAPARAWIEVGEEEVNSCHRYDPVDYRPDAEPIIVNGWFNPTANVAPVSDAPLAIAQFEHFTSSDKSDQPHLMSHNIWFNVAGKED